MSDRQTAVSKTESSGGTELSVKDKKMNQFKNLLGQNMTAIKAAMPSKMDEVRLCRMAMNCLIRNPKLLDCNPASFFLAVLNSAETGLDIGIIGEAALVPYKGMISFQPMFQGLCKLARNSGQISTIYAEVVRDGDHFVREMGLTPKLEHVPKDDNEGAPLTHVYAVAKFKDGGTQYVVLTRKEVEALKNRSPAVRAKASTPWDTDEAEMWKAKAVKRLTKMLPKSAELAKAIAFDDRAEAGLPQTTDMLSLGEAAGVHVAADEEHQINGPKKPVTRAPATHEQPPATKGEAEAMPPQQELYVRFVEDFGGTEGQLLSVLRADGIIKTHEDLSSLTKVKALALLKNVEALAGRSKELQAKK